MLMVVFVTLGEIISLGIITVVLGYIFADYFMPRNPLFQFKPGLKEIKLAAMVVAPAVIIHELFHKFVAMSFGLPALFKVYWMGLAIAFALKMFNSPILILAPAYVMYPATASSFQNMLIAFAGPFANLLMWVGATVWLKYGKLSHKQAMLLYMVKKINILLFIFNMIPLPPFDGYYVFSGLLKVLF